MLRDIILNYNCPLYIIHLIDYDPPMKNKSKFINTIFLLIGFLPFAVFSAPCNELAAAGSSTVEQSPEDYLEFESVLDGKCQILSKGGKLRTVINNHPDKSIKYRFTRMFAGKRQASMAAGTIEPGEKPVKLGCTEVDGYEQTWEIKVVKFVE